MIRILSAFLALPLVLFFLFSSETQAVNITVTTTDDVISPVDGLCSLREAVLSANNDPLALVPLGECPNGAGIDEITFDAALNGTPIELSIAGAGEDAVLTGDLDITSAISFTGNGVENTIIDGNSIDRVFHIIGGSTTVSMAQMTITGGLLNDDEGAGISNGGDLLLDTVTVHTNVVTGTTSAAIGGGVFNSDTLDVIRTTIDNNSAERGSGIFSNNILTIMQSTISNNMGRAGGGITNFGIATMFNSTVSNNTGTGNSAGIDNSTGGTFDILNSTIVENVAPDLGGGGIASNAPGDLTLANSIVANNPGGDCFGGSNVISFGNNLDSDDTCNLDTLLGDIPNVDPMIMALSDNGGPTLTHALMNGSPAVETGNNAGCPAQDQRDTVRPQDGDDDGVPVCDIGALEMLLAELIAQANQGSGGGGCSIAPANADTMAFPLYLLIPALILIRRLRRSLK